MLDAEHARIPVLWREAYGGPLTDIIYSAKYRGQWSSAKLLGSCLGGLPPPWLGQAPSAVPVPMTARRLASRGYSQSHLIAVEAAQHWAIGCQRSWLTKSRDTLRQASLARNERSANLRETFIGRPAMAGQRIVLIDDIMTSGATLQEAARAAAQAGAVVIAAAVIAKVNDHRTRAPSARHKEAMHVQRRAR